MANLEHVPNKGQAKTILGSGDGKADASILIGGSMVDRFVPQIYSSKWDDEAWISINRKNINVPRGEFGIFRDGKMELIIGNTRDTYYITPDGHLEYEISFNDSLPNYIDLELNFPDRMEFWKQLPLTEDEIADGYFRPENVVNSYVAWWCKRNNQYKTGKHGHFYRPFLIDVNKNRVWCDQVINENTWRIISGNEEWLKRATYPITLGPTLGYTVAGLSGANLNNRTFYVRDITDGSGGNVQNFHCAIASITAGTGDDVKMGLFEDSGGPVPGVRLEQVQAVVAAIDDNVIPSVDNDLLTATTNYWVGMISEAANPVGKYDVNGGGLTARLKNGTTFGAEMTDPANSNSATTAVFSIWIDYTAAAGNPWYYYAQQ